MIKRKINGSGVIWFNEKIINLKRNLFIYVINLNELMKVGGLFYIVVSKFSLNVFFKI